MSRIYWDTMLFIYLFEDDAHYGSQVDEIIRRMEERSDVLCTSVFTLGELLVRPVREKDPVMVQRIHETLAPPTVELISLSRAVMVKYAQIRAAHSVSAADALHLASAAELGIDLFLTNDLRLHKLIIPGIQFISPVDSRLL